MPDAPSSARQCDGLPLRQYVHTPHALMQEMMTRSPTATLRTAGADLGDRSDALVAEDPPAVTAGTSP